MIEEKTILKVGMKLKDKEEKWDHVLELSVADVRNMASSDVRNMARFHWPCS